jgi:radical SAM/Cys-rich protein
MVIQINDFEQKITQITGTKLHCKSLDTFQINIGFQCNQSCSHCHQDASPSRKEMMDWITMKKILEVTQQHRNAFIDITGGAPELHPHLQEFIRALRQQNHQVQMRTNLTLLIKPEMKQLVDFLKKNKIQLVASFPCYEEEEVRLQRGDGVFEKSIQALQLLNHLGYGIDPSLPLTLVFNPLHPVLPPEQATLEQEYRQVLKEKYNISFTRLITITNMPIGRFLKNLKKTNQTDHYFTLLKTSFNPTTIEKIMCRNQITIGWDGSLYDCDFNLALKLPVVSEVSQHIKDFDVGKITTRSITTGNHCFGCTAGHGSSCGGALV